MNDFSEMSSLITRLEELNRKIDNTRVHDANDPKRPEYNAMCLVYDGSDTFVTCYNPKTGEFYVDGYIIENVVSWMYLPDMTIKK